MGRAGELWWAANLWLQPHIMDGTFLTMAVATTMLAAVALFAILPDDDSGASASARESDADATDGTDGTDGVGNSETDHHRRRPGTRTPGRAAAPRSARRGGHENDEDEDDDAEALPWLSAGVAVAIVVVAVLARPVAVFMDWTFPASFVELNTMVLAPIVAGCTDNPAVAATIAGCAALSLLAGAFQALPSD